MTDLTRLERFEARTDWPLAIVAFAFLALYSVRVLAKPQPAAAQAIDIALVAIYFVFLLDYLARLWLAQPRGSWFVKHLWELPILLLPFLRPLRLVSLAVVVSSFQQAVGRTFRGKVIIYTVCGAVAIVYAAALAILDVEGNHPELNPEIDTLEDALWWAATTVTTVGYGDIKPVTSQGRLVAVALMIGGITLVGLVTATLASWIVQRVADEDDADQAATRAEIEQLRQEILRLRAADGDAGQSVGGTRETRETREGSG